MEALSNPAIGLNLRCKCAEASLAIANARIKHEAAHQLVCVYNTPENRLKRSIAFTAIMDADNDFMLLCKEAARAL